MNVKELKNYLGKLPDDLPVLVKFYEHDYSEVLLDLDDIEVEKVYLHTFENKYTANLDYSLEPSDYATSSEYVDALILT